MPSMQALEAERRWPRTKRIGRAPASRVLRGVPPATSAASRRQLTSSSSRSRSGRELSHRGEHRNELHTRRDAAAGRGEVVLLVEDLQTPTDQPAPVMAVAPPGSTSRPFYGPRKPRPRSGGHRSGRPDGGPAAGRTGSGRRSRAFDVVPGHQLVDRAVRRLAGDVCAGRGERAR